ncbi:hypothetical protein C8R47DRAFT_1078961 [Mycena vitilis]|nr:hypothetical protein C8R47DRAFT_1078961 [Mycena vitilis]
MAPPHNRETTEVIDEAVLEMPAGLHWLPPPSMNIIQFLGFSPPHVVPLACEFSTEDAASVPNTPPKGIPQSHTIQRLEDEFLQRFRSKTPPHSIRVCYGPNTICEPLWILSFWKRAHEIRKEHTSWTATYSWLCEGPSSPEPPILWQHLSRLAWDGPKIRIREWHAPPSALARLLSDRWLSDEGMDLLLAVLQQQLPPEKSHSIHFLGHQELSLLRLAMRENDLQALAKFRDLVGKRDVAGFWNVAEEHWVVFCTSRATGHLCYGDTLQQGRHCPVVDESLRALLLCSLPQTVLEPTTMRTGIQQLSWDGFSCGPLSAEALLGYLLHRWGRNSHTPMGSHADQRRIWRRRMGVQILELAQAPNATAAPMVPATVGLPTLAGDSMSDIFDALASMTITPRFSREEENAKRQLKATRATTKQLQEDTLEEEKRTQWLVEQRKPLLNQKR